MRWFLLALTFACSSPSGTIGAYNPQRDQDGSAYQSCTTLCLRPGDCQIAYNDDGLCPYGFRCARTFACSPSPSPSP